MNVLARAVNNLACLVSQKYCEYGDAVVGRFKESEGGQKYPSVRAVCKPLLGLFHGERGNK